MQRKSFGDMVCPIARSLEHVGEWWSMLILRDAFAGLTRFDEFQSSLGIAPNMLARRLAALVDGGLLERRRYQEHPPRDEYVLTARGRDFKPVLAALVAFGRRHYPAPGRKTHPRYAGLFSAAAAAGSPSVEAAATEPSRGEAAP